MILIPLMFVVCCIHIKVNIVHKCRSNFLWGLNHVFIGLYGLIWHSCMGSYFSVWLIFNLEYSWPRLHMNMIRNMIFMIYLGLCSYALAVAKMPSSEFFLQMSRLGSCLLGILAQLLPDRLLVGGLTRRLGRVGGAGRVLIRKSWQINKD